MILRRLQAELGLSSQQGHRDDCKPQTCMAMNRVQFQPVSSLTEFPAACGTKEATYTWAPRRARRLSGSSAHAAGARTPSASSALVVHNYLKHSLDGTRHTFQFFKYAERYLGEVVGYFNRFLSIKSIAPHLLVAATRCKPQPERALWALPVYASC